MTESDLLNPNESKQPESVIVCDINNLLKKVRLLEVYPHEAALATILIEQALENARLTSTEPGISIAAAFDLMVAAEYYTKTTNKGWFYCPVSDSPLLVYPYTNTCARCLLKGNFYFSRANKPSSGTIGTTTRRLLGVFLKQLFALNSRKLKIYNGIEPVDLIIYDETESAVLLAEVKAAPLTTLALAVPVELQTELGDDGTPVPRSHSATDNSFLTSSDLHIFLPNLEDQSWNYELISLGVKGNRSSSTWVYEQIGRVFGEDDQLFNRYFQFWNIAYAAYNKKARGREALPEPVYWLTNACGQPSPIPVHWPLRQDKKGYESVSDGKTSVGMDRTDDIKKAIYQVLKVAASQKPQQSNIAVKTAILSNIHAVRHYDEYLLELQDIVWTPDETGQAKKAADLPPDQRLYNLFDGIITFTHSYIRDEWIEQNFTF